MVRNYLQIIIQIPSHTKCPVGMMVLGMWMLFSLLYGEKEIQIWSASIHIQLSSILSGLIAKLLPVT